MAEPELTEGKAERLRRELLAELADDYVGLWDVARMVAAELTTEDADVVREGTMRLVEGMLLLGLIRPGLARDDGGFDPWPSDPRASFLALNDRWDAVGRLPTLGDVAWFDLTTRVERRTAEARAMLEDRDISVGEVCETFGVSKTTLYRHLNGDAKREKEAE